MLAGAMRSHFRMCVSLDRTPHDSAATPHYSIEMPRKRYHIAYKFQSQMLHFTATEASLSDFEARHVRAQDELRPGQATDCL